MTDSPNKGTKPGGGWTDRELLGCLLYVVEKSNVTLNFKDVAYPPGRTAGGFKQKINALKVTLRPQWDAMEAGQPLGDGTGTPKKTATPRKRKGKADADAKGDADGSPKKRGRPKKQVEAEYEDTIDVKTEKVEDEVEAEA